jgi:hypothetical protein
MSRVKCQPSVQSISSINGAYRSKASVLDNWFVAERVVSQSYSEVYSVAVF